MAKRRLGYKVMLATTLLTTVALTGCSKSDDKKEDKPGVDLSQIDRDVPTNDDVTPPTLDFEEDRSTAKGAVFAYYSYLNYGDSFKACKILSHDFMESLGGEAECRKMVDSYASGVRFTFEDSLSIEDAVSVVAKETGNKANVSATIVANEEEGTFFVDSFGLQKKGEEWEIVSIESLDPNEPLN